MILSRILSHCNVIASMGEKKEKLTLESKMEFSYSYCYTED